jgi:hypothetical protein
VNPARQELTIVGLTDGHHAVDLQDPDIPCEFVFKPDNLSHLPIDTIRALKAEMLAHGVDQGGGPEGDWICIRVRDSAKGDGSVY